MSVIREQLYLCNSLTVFLEVGDKLAGPYLKHSDIALHTARADKLTTGSKTYRSYSTFVSVVDLPKDLTVVNSEGSDTAIGPSTDNNFIGKNSAQRHNSDCS